MSNIVTRDRLGNEADTLLAYMGELATLCGTSPNVDNSLVERLGAIHGFAILARGPWLHVLSDMPNSFKDVPFSIRCGNWIVYGAISVSMDPNDRTRCVNGVEFTVASVPSIEDHVGEFDITARFARNGRRLSSVVCIPEYVK